MNAPSRTAIVIGASGGIGAALVAALVEDTRYETIWALSRSSTGEDCGPRIRSRPADLADEATIDRAAREIGAAGKADLVIVATGLLHDAHLRPERSYREIDAEAMAEIFAVNTIGPALAAKHLLPLLRRPGRSVFAALSARVGSIADNRTGGWHSYRASKAALNMLLKNFSIELAVRAPEAICVGLHPGTVDTGLSQPFQRNVAAGKLFTPAYAAERLLAVIAGLTVADTGCCLAWDGSRIEP